MSGFLSSEFGVQTFGFAKSSYLRFKSFRIKPKEVLKKPDF